MISSHVFRKSLFSSVQAYTRSPRFRERFWKDAFSLTVFTGCVWTVGQTGRKKPPFSNENGYMWTGPQSSVSLPMPFLLFYLLCYFIPSLHVYWVVIFIYCWSAGDVTTAMLAVKNKSISLLWELNSIFISVLREKVLLYWPPTWPPCHVVANQESFRLVVVSTVFCFLFFQISWHSLLDNHVIVLWPGI